MKDSTHIRGIHQGMVLWAQTNQDRLPLPSEIDRKDTTVTADTPEAKDTTANIVSVLIFNGFFSPELCVSPAESNANIRVNDGYEYTEPKAAAGADKLLALWDPAFSADFTKPGGNLSYAHAIPNGTVRSELWRSTFSDIQPIIGNRGPEIGAHTQGKSPNVGVTLKNAKSNTLLIHGGRETWEGNIAYADNHVAFETDVFGPSTARTYADSAGSLWKDCLFLDEPDDVASKNSFLGVFLKAGKEPIDFTAIWD